jgi:uncharacterized delta-60 repeat protein
MFATLGGTTAWARAGDLDPSFSGDGRVTFGFPHSRGGNFCYGLASQPNDKLVVVGGTGLNDTSFGIARLTRRGRLDHTFSHDGRAVISYPFGKYDEAAARDVAVQPDGKIVVTGYLSAQYGPSYFGIVGLNRDGTLDRGFSGNGRQTIVWGRDQSFREPVSVALQPDGKILVAGARSRSPGRSAGLLVARLNPDGSRDRTFSGNGRALIHTKAREPSGGALAVDPFGAIVVVGSEGNDTHSNVLVTRLTEAGDPDRSFADRGRRKLAFGARYAYGEAVAVERQGKVFIAGESGGRFHDHFALARLEANGRLDRSFSANGKTTSRIGRESYSSSMGIQADGRAVILGTSKGRHRVTKFALARYGVHGRLDQTFGEAGIRTIGFGPPGALKGASGSDLAIQSSGKLAVAGFVNPRRYELDYGVARVLP